jgi:hypothetical protein
MTWGFVCSRRVFYDGARGDLAVMEQESELACKAILCITVLSERMMMQVLVVPSSGRTMRDGGTSTP